MQKFWLLLLVPLAFFGCRGTISDFELARRAVQSGDLAQLQTITKKIDVNHRVVDSNPYLGNSTLLHQAVELNNLEVVRHLLNNGADPNLKNSLGQTSLMLAVRTHKPDSKSLTVLVELIKKGGNVNTQDNDGNTPLEQASILWESKKYQEVLIKHGAKKRQR